MLRPPSSLVENSPVEKVIELAKHIIHEELERRGFSVRQIILFGSRARGDFRPDSDWDFFVIVDRDISDAEYRTGSLPLKSS
ncbi:MAG: nucleotidyltransferase domain-containing protein [Armatimonadota bacterium]